MHADSSITPDRRRDSDKNQKERKEKLKKGKVTEHTERSCLGDVSCWVEKRAEEKKKKGGKKNTPGQTGSHQLEPGKFVKTKQKPLQQSQHHFARCGAKNVATEGPVLGLMNGGAGLIFRPGELLPPGHSAATCFRGRAFPSQNINIPTWPLGPAVLAPLRGQGSTDSLCRALLKAGPSVEEQIKEEEDRNIKKKKKNPMWRLRESPQLSDQP